MKTILSAALLFSSSVFAQIPAPTDFILDAAPSSLRFIGKKLMKGSISVKSCVFENDRVIVIYGNCTKREAPATNIRILSRTGGMIAVSIENSDATEKKGSISTLTRASYDGSFTVSYKLTPPVENTNLDLIDEIASGRSDICYTSADLQPIRGNPGYGAPKSGCFGTLEAMREEWMSLGLSFWQEPGADWYQFLRDMRRITSTLP